MLPRGSTNKMSLHKSIFLFLFRSSKGKDAGLQNHFVSSFYKFWYHFQDIYRSRRAFVCPQMCLIDRNAANGPNIMLPFTDTHNDDLNHKIYAPNMAAPQTGAYLALRRMYMKCKFRPHLLHFGT